MTATCSAWDKERNSFCSWGRWQREVPWFGRKREKQGSQPEGEKPSWWTHARKLPVMWGSERKALRARCLPFAFGLQYGPFLLLPNTEYLVESSKCSEFLSGIGEGAESAEGQIRSDLPQSGYSDDGGGGVAHCWCVCASFVRLIYFTQSKLWVVHVVFSFICIFCFSTVKKKNKEFQKPPIGNTPQSQMTLANPG